ncbi:MAG: DUF1232 domain-containing protein [Alkalinema sp. CAN_BIN05]|nr:DUF1232 domain-containing protein [Alkalinema sp. CAN_BIN05]
MTTYPLQILYSWYRKIVANPKYRWWIIGGTLIYLISPIDILPDVFPIVGQIDDAVLITLVASEISSAIKDRNAMLKQQRSDAKTVKIPEEELGSTDHFVDVSAVEVM